MDDEPGRGMFVAYHMQTLIHYLIVYGTALVFGNVLLEQLGLPIPALPTLIVAGSLIRDGKLSLTPIIAGALVASLIADWIWFELGRAYGFRMLRLLCRISLSPDSCVSDTEALFHKWGLPSLVIAKFVPGFSTVAPPLAGAMKSSRTSFLFFDAAGALIWAGSGLLLGFVFRHTLHEVFGYLDRLGSGAIVAVVSVLALIVLVKWLQRRQFYRQLRMARISPAALKELFDSGQSVVVLDVRTPSAREREQHRIPGAMVMRPDEIEARLGDMTPHQDIILYCT